MTTVSERPRLAIGPESNGTLFTPREFDRAEFEEGWRYELINGVLVVTPIAAINERDPNEELGYLLRGYKDSHEHGPALDMTIHEYTMRTGQNRRRADRVIWARLGRLPSKRDVPSIVVEFVSSRRRDRIRDYETKRDEYLEIGVKEYWVIDRFQRTLTVMSSRAGKVRTRVFKEGQNYESPLLPGFELPLKRLLSLADRWPEGEFE